MDILFIEKIEKRLAEELPGSRAHMLMSPVEMARYSHLPSQYLKACVLILLYPKADEWHLVLIERTTHDKNDKHAGQISFPGGKLNPSDDSLEVCALRETYEEIGVSPDKVGLLGALSEIYVYVSNFLVHPFVGFTYENPRFSKQDSEVAEIIEIPLEHILNSKNKKRGPISVRDYSLPNVPYYDIYQKPLWGATAMILSEFEHLVKDCW